MRYKKQISMLLIFLILSIPVYASGSLSNFMYSGSQGTDRVLSRTDSVDVSVDAQITENGQPVALNENNVRIKLNDYEETFDSCSGTDVYTCTYSTGMRDWPTGKYDLQVTLYDNFFVKLDQETGSFYIDSLPPKIKSFSTDVQGMEQLTISYSVVDEACTGCSGICSGLQRIDILINDAVTESITDFSGCSGSGSKTIPASGLGEGNIDICIEAYDLFGFSATQCDTVFIDTTPPEVDDGSFIITIDGTEIDYLSGLSSTVQISIDITDYHSGISASDVRGDFSGLDSSIEGPKWQTPTCTPIGDVYTCTWDVKIFGVSGSVPITIEVTDKSGNTNSVTKTVNIRVDTTNPVVVGIRPDYVKREDNTIVLEIQETESGFDNADATLDLHYLGLSTKRADECIDQSGVWECLFENIRVSGNDGDELTVRVTGLRDDVGNEWDEAKSMRLHDVVLDTTVPKVLNISVMPLGVDIDLIREGDVVLIEAYIYENGSGLDADAVLADYHDLYDAENYSGAASCETDNSSIYLCTWQYAGPVDINKQIKLNVIAEDRAGNSVDSADTGVYGMVYAAGITEQDVDFWKDSAEAYDIKGLNRNFLWMSSTGTYIRAGIELQPNRGTSYVHGFDVTSCSGGFGDRESFQPFTIKDQFYYPNIAHSDKYILINVPSFAKEDIGSEVTIHCYAEVIQGRNSRSNVFSPNEKVNVTITVPLTSDLYSEPDMAAIDKINTKKSQIKTLNKLIGYLEMVTKLLQGPCTAAQLIRQLVDSVCAVWEIVQLLYSKGTDKTCFWTFIKLDSLWYGYDKTKIDGKEYGDLFENGMLPQSSKKLISIGYLCDLVICEDCGNFWGTYTSGAQQWMKDRLGGGAWSENVPNFEFSPYESLIVAIWCSPPCLYGIQLKLQTYKQILTIYNVCVNVATVRGEDISECDEFYKHQVCQQIIGEFWYLAQSFITQYIINMAMWVLEDYLLKLKECVPGSEYRTEHRIRCYLADAYRIAAWYVAFVDVKEKWEEMKEQNWNETLSGWQDTGAE